MTTQLASLSAPFLDLTDEEAREAFCRMAHEDLRWDQSTLVVGSRLCAVFGDAEHLAMRQVELTVKSALENASRRWRGRHLLATDQTRRFLGLEIAKSLMSLRAEIMEASGFAILRPSYRRSLSND